MLLFPERARVFFCFFLFLFFWINVILDFILNKTVILLNLYLRFTIPEKKTLRNLEDTAKKMPGRIHKATAGENPGKNSDLMKLLEQFTYGELLTQLLKKILVVQLEKFPIELVKCSKSDLNVLKFLRKLMEKLT